MEKRITITSLIIVLFLLVSCLNSNKKSELVIDAGDYGLKEGVDNTKALITALDVCKRKGASKLIIPKGTYDVYPDKAVEKFQFVPNNDDGLKRIVFLLEDFKDFEIDGQGSNFICHDHMLLFSLEKSKNITLKNFTVDWAMPFYLQAKVVDVHPEENAFDLEIFEECNHELHGDQLIFTNKKNIGKSEWLNMAPPAQEKVRWEQNINWNIWFNPETKAPVFNVEAPNRLHSWNVKLNKPATAKELGGNVVRLYNASKALPKIDWRLIVKGKLQKNRLSPVFDISKSKDITLQNVTVHHSSGIALIAHRTENITLQSYNVLLPPDSERMVTTTADATHFIGCKGLIKLNDCVFENMLDDATNVHGAYADVHDAVDDYTIGMSRGHSQQQGYTFAEKGDRIVLLNKESHEPYSTFTVESVNEINSYYFEVTFKEKVKDLLQKETMADNITWQPDVEMRNCTVRNNRARSILISTSGNVIIEDNSFIRCTYTGIMIAGFHDWWYESGPINNVVIRKNLFEDMGLGAGNAPIVAVAANVNKKVKPPFYLHKNLIFEDNIIKTFGRTVILAKSLENFQFRRNTIERSQNYPVVANKKLPVFIFDRCKDIVIEENTYEWGGIATIKAIETEGLVCIKNKNITIR
jgi:hypothetical protein